MNPKNRLFLLIKPEFFFPLIILIFGFVLIIITPIGANYDEETYVARIYEMASGYVIPNSYISAGQNYPLELISNSYRQDVNLWPVDGPTWIDQAKDRIDWKNGDIDKKIKYKTRAVYFPTLFVIQAIMMRVIGISFNLSIVLIYYAIRLSYLIIYFFLVHFAIKIIPFSKWVLGVIAVGPMALITASSVSPDPIIFGICFLFSAWILYLINIQKGFITYRQLIITCSFIISICTLKPNYIFILFLLFALPLKGFLKRKDFIVIFLVCFVGIGISLGWTYLASKVYFNQLNIPNDSGARFWSLINSPQVFLQYLAKTLEYNYHYFLIDIIGISGYDYWRLPSFVYFLYPFTVLLAFFIEENNNHLSFMQKIVFFSTGVINFLVIFILFFVSNTPLSSPIILGVSGRYFIPFIFFLLLPLGFNKPIRLIRPLFCASIGIVFIFSTITLFLDFHVMCGESITSKNPCKLPYYKNWGPETFISANLPKGSAIIQNIIVDCQTISHIEIWPLHNDEEKDQQVVVNMRTGAGDLLGSSSFSTSEVNLNKWFSVDIPDVIGMKGTAITIEILPAEDHDLSQFALGVFPTNEYTKGELFVKDGPTGKSTTSDNDLIFKYQCEKP